MTTQLCVSFFLLGWSPLWYQYFNINIFRLLTLRVSIFGLNTTSPNRGRVSFVCHWHTEITEEHLDRDTFGWSLSVTISINNNRVIIVPSDIDEAEEGVGSRVNKLMIFEVFSCSKELTTITSVWMLHIPLKCTSMLQSSFSDFVYLETFSLFLLWFLGLSTIIATLEIETPSLCNLTTLLL